MSNATIKISQQIKPIAMALDDLIEEIAGERIAFTLIIYTEGRASYVSTVEREESIKEIKKMLDHWEKGMPDIPAHEVS